MSIDSLSDNKRHELVLKLADIKKLLIESYGLIDEMFDPETQGHDDWTIKFKQDSYSLQDEITKLNRIIAEYI